MEQKVTFKNGAGQKLAGILHVPEGEGPFAAVVRAHGYSGSKDGRTGQVLAEHFQDVVFFRFDFHGHGESEGHFEDVDAAQCIDDLKCAIEYVASLEQVNNNKIAVTGSSLGGLSTLLAVAWHGNVSCAVPVCPVSRINNLRGTQIKYQQLVDTNIHEECEAIEIPLLIVHGDKDDIVPIKDSQDLIEHLGRGELHTVKGANHVFEGINEYKEYIDTVVSFIRGHFDG